MIFTDMKEGTVGDMRTLGVVESYKAKKQMLTSGAEAAEMILRVDDIIKCAPRWVLSHSQHVNKVVVIETIVQLLKVSFFGTIKSV